MLWPSALKIPSPTWPSSRSLGRTARRLAQVNFSVVSLQAHSTSSTVCALQVWVHLQNIHYERDVVHTDSLRWVSSLRRHSLVFRRLAGFPYSGSSRHVYVREEARTRAVLCGRTLSQRTFARPTGNPCICFSVLACTACTTHHRTVNSCPSFSPCLCIRCYVHCARRLSSPA